MKTGHKKFLTIITLALITLLMVSPGLYANALNPASQGNWVTLQVDLTGMPNVTNIDARDITLHYGNDSISPEKIQSLGNKQKTSRFLVKFGRAELIKMLEGTTGDITLTVKVKGTKVKDFIIKMVSSSKSNPAAKDQSAPRIQSATVADYSLTLTYNETLDKESIPDADDFSVYVSGKLIGEASYVDIDQNKILLLLPQSAHSGETVRITYTPGTNRIIDLAGNQAAAFEYLTVTNNSSQSSGSPVLVATNPDNLAYGTAIDDDITIFFNEDIQAGTKIANITISKETGNISAKVDANFRIDHNKLILNPDKNFDYYTKYTVVIPVGAVKDLNGYDNALTWRFSFTTGGPELNYLSSGAGHTAVRNNASKVFVWGAYDTFHEISSPVLVSSLQDIIALSSGNNFTLALKKDGTVWAWGDNGYGQLGNGKENTAHESIPAKVVGPEGNGYLQDIVAIASGDRHALALESDGTVWAWGDNSSGQLGNGDNDYQDSFVPVQVQNKNATGNLTDITDIDCGYEHSIALKKDGTVWTWGSNEYSQLGIHPGIEASVVPVQVVGTIGINTLTGVKDIDAGRFHNISLNKDGTVFSWGLNSDGQLGNNSGLGQSYKPVKAVFPSSTKIISLSAGGYTGHSLALDSQRNVWAWGDNKYGQLGINSYQDAATPLKISGLSNILELSAGGEDGHSIALDRDGKVWTWGSNRSGQLGRDLGDLDQSSRPAKITDLDLITN